MKAFIAIIFTVSVVLAENAREKQSHKDKRGISNYGSNPLNLDPFNGLSSYDASLWNPVNIAHPIWDSAITSDLALGRVQLQATHNLALQTLQDHHQGTPSIAYSPEVLRAIQHAKEANHHVHLAQHRVDEAKQAAILQQRIALAKEAAAREAAHRSAEIAAHAEAEARASAKHLVALQQRLATLKDAVAAAQRVAAARETAAAAAIQRSAADTAAELRKQDVDKQITQSEREARARDLVAAKENAISQALHNNAVQKQAPAHHPWS
ncbi:uncharacterized protein LOC100679145 [Nasonia vitripennis]|uniref:Uncharacterized protein n=1 Tax=Nasonia vitripennis TaxID=7425 RepID=A0A7M7GEN2_NASVI|nr:uncharacterized protein LOC100679145 [Nasonia vitripennis]